MFIRIGEKSVCLYIKECPDPWVSTITVGRHKLLAMDLLPKIRQVLEAEPNEVQLDKYLADVKDSLASSNKQFLRFSLATLVALITYHIVVFEGASSQSFEGLPLSTSAFLQKVFLVVPAALMCAMSSIGFLRRCQREVYDYLIISRYRPLAQTGLHELRLPSDYILGLFYLKTEGGLVGRILSGVVMFLVSLVFTFGPAIYIAQASGESVARHGLTDPLALGGAIVAVLLTGSSVGIAFLAGRIRP